ncbi:MAG TPA: carboxypeptidase-like regulatory domain-containing protein, partial [Acidimicrobiia bacterium]|nr:carboxypeptidase-like regulatory domain-containing protein [Acidimicrobiia bacterium]
MPSLLFRSRSVPARLLVALIVGLVAAPGLITPALAADVPTGQLSGVVRDEQGTVVSKARVRLLHPATEQEAGAGATGTNGRYALAAPAGVYDLLVTAGPSGSPYSAVIRDIAVPAADATFDVVVVRPDATLSGKVVDGAGAPLSNVTVRLEGSGVFGPAVTGIDGSFVLRAPHGVYQLMVRSDPERGRHRIEAHVGGFDLKENRTETLRLPVTEVDVAARTDLGDPSTGFVNIACDRCEVDGDLFPGADTRYSMWTGANLSSGTARLTGLPATNATVYLSGSEILAELNRPGVDLTKAGGVTVTQRTLDPDRVHFRGQVTDQHGTPLDGDVTLHNDDYRAKTELWDGGRSFDLSVPPGTYQLKLRLNAETAWNLDGEHSDYTEGVFITLDGLELTADRTQNLTVPMADFAVHVLEADGHPTSASVDGTSGQIPDRREEGNAAVELFPGAVGYGMVENRNVDTDGNGTAHLKILPGAAPPVVTASAGTNSAQARPGKSATEATVRLSRYAYIGGAIRDVNGTLAQPVRVSVASHDDYTYDSADFWSLAAPTGRYPIAVSNPHGDEHDYDFEPVPGPTRPARWSLHGDFDLEAGDTTVDLTIPDADYADIWLYGPDGRPAWVDAVTSASSVTAGIVLAPGIIARGYAESDPVSEVGHIRTPMFGPSNVWVSNDGNWRRNFAFVHASPNDTVHVVSAVAGTAPPADPGPADPPSTTAPPTAGPDPGAGGAATAPGATGYWALANSGQVYSFGATAGHGNAAGGAADLEPTPSGKGYWILNGKGAVEAFGDAMNLGDVEPGKLAKDELPASLSATPSGKGYWVFTSRGRAIPFGDASFHGDVSDVKLNGPVLGSVATPSGKGYYMVASDGGIFAFGDARFEGSMGGTTLNQPVQSLVPDSDGKGYWLVAS